MNTDDQVQRTTGGLTVDDIDLAMDTLECMTPGTRESAQTLRQMREWRANLVSATWSAGHRLHAAMAAMTHNTARPVADDWENLRPSARMMYQDAARGAGIPDGPHWDGTL